ncbi:MAG TPA: rhodanese-like domain-containing protein [Rhodocyclaceae bacterium]|nr:rhodanese-like domain-containing protein [Rhodocyclaceae bacterium]
MMEFLQQNVFLVILVLSSGGMLVWELLKGGGSNNLTAAEATLKINRENALVVDVREANEWSTGHIPDARHIALGQLEKRLHEIEKFKDRPVIVCCASGVRSANACKQLRKAGFSQVFNLNGGVSSWGDANLPLTTK